MTRTDSRRIVPLLLLLAGTLAIFLAGLGRLPLFGRDEALYAEAGREMLATGDWVTPRVNGGPFLEKPPLYYWMAAVSYRALEASPFAARLPAALMGILTVFLTASIGARVWGRRAGLLAGASLATSLQMAMIGRMGILDVPLTCLTVLALMAYAGWRRRAGIATAVGFGLCVGLAVLLKGMAGMLPVAVAVVHTFFSRGRPAPEGGGEPAHAVPAPHRLAPITMACLVAILVASPWFVLMAMRHGEAFGSTLFLREHLTRMVQPMQGHGGPVWYYLALIAVSFFPWVVFLPAAMRPGSRPCNEDQAFWQSLALAWIAVVLIPFSLVSTKLPGYVTPLFPAMALLVGAELDRNLHESRRGAWIAAIAGAFVLSVLVVLLPIAGERLGARVGASHAASLLIPPVAIWVGGYGLIALGSIRALAGGRKVATGMLLAGQCVIVAAVLGGVLPVLSPYLGGASSSLAELAQRELPNSQVVLYQTRAESVAFVLERSVPVFSSDQQQQLLDALRAQPTALLAPLGEDAFWAQLPARRIWRNGDHVLLDIPRTSDEPAERPAT